MSLKHLTPVMSASLASTYLILSLNSITGDRMFTQNRFLLFSVLIIDSRNCNFDGRSPSLGCQLQNAFCLPTRPACPGLIGVMNIRLVSYTMGILEVFLANSTRSTLHCKDNLHPTFSLIHLPSLCSSG